MPPPFPVVNRRGQEIVSLDDWERLAAPVSAGQWRPGYSACELARTWMGNRGLEALRGVLDLAYPTSDVTVQRGVAEAQTRFDSYGGPRQHDLLLTGEGRGGRMVVAIEGKVNESFGETLAKYRRTALSRRERGEATNAPERLDGVTRALAGWTLHGVAADPRATLRYQLFSAVAGTIAQAALDGARFAVFCVHKLVTAVSTDEARADNSGDLDTFMATLYPDAQRVANAVGWIAGPVAVASPTPALPADVTLYIAKLSTPPR
jgi:hypothetical protein